MPTNYNKQAAAYHGISGAKYALRTNGAPGTPVVAIEYAKSMSFAPQVEEQPVYANDRKVLALVSDTGYTGSLGTSAQDRGFETALGHIMTTAQGQATVNLLGHKRADLYYEYKEESEGGVVYTVKVWALNVEVGKATLEHATDENTAKIGEYAYPITVYGDKIKAATGDGYYRDANGNELTATSVISLPGDTGYATFGDTVPGVKMAPSGG